MALPNRIKTTIFDFEGGQIVLKATLENLEALKADVGSDPIAYIGEALTIDSLDQLATRITAIFYNLQDGAERESKASIHAWLFGVMDDWLNEKNVLNLAACMSSLMGRDIADAIAQYEQGKTTGSTKKK